MEAARRALPEAVPVAMPEAMPVGPGCRKVQSPGGPELVPRQAWRRGEAAVKMKSCLTGSST